MSDVTKKIVFAFGTVGASGFASQMGTVAKRVTAATAAIGVAVAAMSKMVAKSDELSMAVRANYTDMSEFDRRTGGMIDTLAKYQKAVAAQEARLNLTAEQFANIGAAAAQMAQNLGEGGDGATRRFKQLTEAITNGTTRGLRPFGIELSEGGTIIEKQQKALQILAERYGGVEVSAKNATERMYSLHNSIDTVMTMEFAGWWAEVTENLKYWTVIVNGGTDAVRELEAQSEATGGAINQWRASMDGIITRFQMLAPEIANVLGYLIPFVGQIGVISKYVFGKDLIGAAADKLFGDTAAEAEEWYQTQLEGFTAAEAARKRTAAAAGDQRAEMVAATAPSISRGGGGGSRRDLDPGMVFDESEIDFILAQQQAAASSAWRAEHGAHVSDRGRGSGLQAQYMMDGGGPRGQDAGASMGAAMTGASELEELAAMHQAVEDAYREHYAELARMESGMYIERRTMRELDKKEQYDAAMAMTSTMSDTFGNIAETIGDSSEKSFNAQKAFLIPAAIMEGTMASIAAFRSTMQSVPAPINMVLAPLNAAAVAAATAAQVATIASQRYGGGGKKVSAPAPIKNTTGGIGARSEQSQNYHFDIIVEGQRIHSAMIASNQMREQQGQKYFVTGGR
jgi:hypothetical protein